MSRGLSMLALVLSGCNLVVLGALAVVWIRNYRIFGNRQVLALCCFALLLAGENVAALAFQFSMNMFYAETADAVLAATALRALQFVALCFLAWATLR